MKILRKTLLASLLALPLVSFAAPEVEVGFSPEGSAHQLVLKTIEGARHSIRMMAYAFSAPDIVQALGDATRRGVEVRVVVDKKRNADKAGQRAIRDATAQGVALRTNDRYTLHHDKVIIVDDDTVETGSFNFAPSAERSNSENVVVLRGLPEITRQYVAHWQSRWDAGEPWASR
ncbi:MAG: phospholipase D family protein [Candidatus Dactylopiibacterium sp.]|nr:phospholipase D family protein [Candidatus Dactylopiibacterium sp.]